jgi:uncharacterized membrane protein YkvI
MKHLNAYTYAIFFAGCYLGAGFVSGNELTQFFGNFGLNGFFGLLIIFIGFSAIGTVAAHFAKSTGITEVDRLAVGEGCRPLRTAIGTMQLLLMFAILTIVHAGIGALLHSLFSIPVWLGSLLFASLILPIALLGISGVARVLAVSVPLLTATVVTLALCLLPRWIASGFPMPHGDADNPLLPTFWIAAITYISFNMGGNITVVLASTPNVKRERILPGTVLGSLLLAVVAATIMIVLSLYPDAMADELPMLTAAREVHPILGYAYGLLLFLAMSGSGLSKCFGISHYVARKWKIADRHPRLFMVALIALAYVCSLVGFGDLVGTVYPVFGYLSILLLIAMVWRACAYFKKKKES